MVVTIQPDDASKERDPCKACLSASGHSHCSHMRPRKGKSRADSNSLAYINFAWESSESFAKQEPGKYFAPNLVM